MDVLHLINKDYITFIGKNQGIFSFLSEAPIELPRRYYPPSPDPEDPLHSFNASQEPPICGSRLISPDLSLDYRKTKLAVPVSDVVNTGPRERAYVGETGHRIEDDPLPSSADNYETVTKPRSKEFCPTNADFPHEDNQSIGVCGSDAAFWSWLLDFRLARPHTTIPFACKCVCDLWGASSQN